MKGIKREDEKKALEFLKKSKDQMARDIGLKLREGYVVDLRKPEIDKFERAAIIRQVLQEKGWSIRQMARVYGINKSTIEDWLLYERIEETEYRKMVKQGVTPTMMYRELRDRKKDGPRPRFYALDVHLKDATSVVKHAVNHLEETSEETPGLIAVLRNELNRLESAIERKK